jgi:hypothetical protein
LLSLWLSSFEVAVFECVCLVYGLFFLHVMLCIHGFSVLYTSTYIWQTLRLEGGLVYELKEHFGSVDSGGAGRRRGWKRRWLRFNYLNVYVFAFYSLVLSF